MELAPPKSYQLNHRFWVPREDEGSVINRGQIILGRGITDVFADVALKNLLEVSC
jgi:hypothetical protein